MISSAKSLVEIATLVTVIAEILHQHFSRASNATDWRGLHQTHAEDKGQSDFPGSCYLKVPDYR
jgi:hypothetical protein